jgi:uncharacterized membrane protein
MSASSHLSALIAYLLPVVGWVYVGLFRRQDAYARFHLRQAISLALLLLATTAGWAILAWAIAWIPYGFIFSMALFGLVIVVYIFGFFVWMIGMVNALRGNKTNLPVVGDWATRLPL